MLAAREELEVGLEVKIMPAPASLMARIVHRNAHAFRACANLVRALSRPVRSTRKCRERFIFTELYKSSE